MPKRKLQFQKAPSHGSTLEWQIFRSRYILITVNVYFVAMAVILEMFIKKLSIFISNLGMGQGFWKGLNESNQKIVDFMEANYPPNTLSTTRQINESNVGGFWTMTGWEHTGEANPVGRKKGSS